MMKNKQTVPKRTIEEICKSPGKFLNLSTKKELKQMIRDSNSENKQTREEALSNLADEAPLLRNKLVNLYKNWDYNERGLKENIIKYDYKVRKAKARGLWKAPYLRALTSEMLDKVEKYESYINNDGVQKEGYIKNRTHMPGLLRWGAYYLGLSS